MKYGKTLRQEKIEKFSMHYLQYKELKRKIKEIHRLLLSDKSMTHDVTENGSVRRVVDVVRMKQHPLEIAFMTFVDTEVQKVNSFSTKMVGDLRMKARPDSASGCITGALSPSSRARATARCVSSGMRATGHGIDWQLLEISTRLFDPGKSVLVCARSPPPFTHPIAPNEWACTSVVHGSLFRGRVGRGRKAGGRRAGAGVCACARTC